MHSPTLYLKVLNLEDSPNDSELLEHRLRASGIECEFLRVDNKEQFEHALRTDSFDIVLCDYNLPTYDGISATKLARTIQPSTPIIIISGSIGEELAVECIHVGASDYVLKQRPERFPIAVRRVVHSANEQRRLQIAESRLRESELRLHTILSTLNEVIWRSDPGEIRPTYISPAFEKVWGRSVADCLSHPNSFIESVHPEDRHPFLQDIQKQATGQPTTNEYRILRPDGSIRWIYDQGFPIFGPNGNVIEVHGIAADITERKHAELELDLQRRRVTAIVDSSMDAIITIDEAQNIVVFNPAAESMFLCPAKEAIGQPINQFVPERFRRQHTAHVQQFGDSGQTTRPMGHRGEVYGRRANGEEFPMESSISVVELNGQKLLTVNCRDVTQNRIAEAERQRLQRHLNKTQKMEAIGTLAGGIAHDFNNILGVIIGNTELALMELDPECGAIPCLDQISKASNRAKNLVRQILTFSRQQPLEQQVTSLEPILQETFSLLRSTLPASIELQCHVATDSPPVLVDPTQIHQVLMNLCTNAWHAIGARAGTILISLERVELRRGQIQGELTSGEFACLSVTDNGAGMAPSTLDRIFEPFFTTKAPGEGTGLGLAVVHGIVKSHGGSISVQSTLGKGTAFHLYFPIAYSAPQSPPPPPPRIIHGNHERILIVDDELPLVLITQRALERIHYLTESFTRPEESIRSFQQDPTRFHLAIVDLNMPGMNGLQLATKLLEIQPTIPILLISGNGYGVTQEEATRIGIRALLAKPHSLEELSHVVHQLLHQSPSTLSEE